jgi:hypothetical protein
MPLIITPTQAWGLLHRVAGCRFSQGLANHFRINADGTVDFECVCWLYRWAIAGWNRAQIAAQIRQIWLSMFGFPVTVFNPIVFKPVAGKYRY